MSDIYPWQRQQWRLLQERLAAGRLPHALLLSGMEGMGKLRFANALASSLMCRYRDGEGFACGECPPCIRFQAGTHPDFLMLRPAAEGKALVVDQVRESGEFLALKSHYEGGRVVLMAPAEALNRAAANSLLKTLEEPPPGVLLILVAARPAALPATIRSRCQQVAFLPPERGAALEWLQGELAGEYDARMLLELAGGAPLRARMLAQDALLERRAEMLQGFEQISAGRMDPVALAQQWLRQGEVAEALFWLDSWVLDMLRLKYMPQPPLLANRDLAPRLLQIARHIEPRHLSGYLEMLGRMVRRQHGSLNMQLQLEDLLVVWAALAHRAENP